MDAIADLVDMRMRIYADQTVQCGTLGPHKVRRGCHRNMGVGMWTVDLSSLNTYNSIRLAIVKAAVLEDSWHLTCHFIF